MIELPYKKIERFIKYRILRGEYSPGQKLLSIRTIAKEMGYNPATVHYALSCLQQQELIVSQTTVGYFVTADLDKIKALRTKEIEMLIDTLLYSLYALRYSDLEIYKLIREKC